MNISVDGNKRCPVISIDGEIMGTPSGVPDFLHISEDKSLDLPAEIRNNPLFAKNLSLILHLHRLLSQIRGKFDSLELMCKFDITLEEAKLSELRTDKTIKSKIWEDINVVSSYMRITDVNNDPPESFRFRGIFCV